MIRAVVIGAGLGGLATAARLAHAGCQVTVLERHRGPGGRAGLWESRGFRFDTGPSLVLMVEYWEQLFREGGRRLADYVTLVQLDPNYRIHYPDGSTLEITSRMNTLLNVMDASDDRALRRVFTRWSVVGWTATGVLFYGLWVMVTGSIQ